MGGFFGTVQKQKCTADLFYGTDYQSHLGTKRGGMATLSDSGEFLRSIHNLENTYFRSRFEPELDKFQGKSGIGVISDTDAQPMLMNSHLGRFAIVTVAKITNQDELAQQLLDEGGHLSEFSSGKINPTELIALLIIKGKDFVDGIEIVYKHIKGSCSMLLLTENGIIAARDSWGRTPIVVGKKDGALAVTSETSAFPNLGFETTYYVGPGEIIRITSDVMTVLRKPNPRMQICSFLWVYYGFPASDYEGINTEYVREACGKQMGEDDDTEADLVCGIPDSGVGTALGYAEGHKIPYKRAVLKYTPTWPRSFMPTIQSKRDMIAKMKLIPVHELIEHKRLLLIDDSIVRGTQLRETVEFLYSSGAKEVHVRPACPPIMFGCKYLNFSRSNSEMELIARRMIQQEEGEDVSLDILYDYCNPDSSRYLKMVDMIKKQQHFTTLRYNRLDDLLEATGLDANKLCTYCWNGKE